MTKEQETEVAVSHEAGKQITSVLQEVAKALQKFPTWPDDPIHAHAILVEEVGELGKEVLQGCYEKHKYRDMNDMKSQVKKEAIQAAAMALRFLFSLDEYVYAPGHQHDQPALDSLANKKEGGNAEGLDYTGPVDSGTDPLQDSSSETLDIQVYASLEGIGMYEEGLRSGLSEEAANYFRCLTELPIFLRANRSSGWVVGAWVDTSSTGAPHLAMGKDTP